MTQLLVSVRNAAEASAALHGGADWIDLKEPASGPLGAVDAPLARSVVELVSNEAHISAAAGELVDWAQSAARDLLTVEGIGQLKLGLSGNAGRAWQSEWLAAQREIRLAGKELVAVIYADSEAADSPPPLAVLELAIEARCRWLLIDTFDKRSGRLGDCLDMESVGAMFHRARMQGLTTAAAGRLTVEAIGRLPLEEIDVVAVRSAACGGDRNGTVIAERVAALRNLLHPV